MGKAWFQSWQETSPDPVVLRERKLTELARVSSLALHYMYLRVAQAHVKTAPLRKRISQAEVVIAQLTRQLGKLDITLADGELFARDFILTEDEPVTDSLPVFAGKERWQEWTRSQ